MIFVSRFWVSVMSEMCRKKIPIVNLEILLRNAPVFRETINRSELIKKKYTITVPNLLGIFSANGGSPIWVFWLVENLHIGSAKKQSMRLPTIFLLIVTILLTIIFMQNTGEIKVTILFADVYLPKLVIFTGIAVVSFIVGVLVGRPRKLRRVEDFERHEDMDAPPQGKSLSDEDRDYIS